MEILKRELPQFKIKKSEILGGPELGTAMVMNGKNVLNKKLFD